MSILFRTQKCLTIFQLTRAWGLELAKSGREPERSTPRLMRFRGRSFRVAWRAAHAARSSTGAIKKYDISLLVNHSAPRFSLTVCFLNLFRYRGLLPEAPRKMPPCFGPIEQSAEGDQ
jgi:hypothetical protein